MKIKTEGLKGRDREVNIDKLTLLVGPNESGKSTIVDGVRLGALGFVPSLGKRNEDTAALMREREASVEIEHDGKLWNRKMKNTGKKLTGSVECAWLKNAKPTEHATAILHLFGKEEIDVAEIMDIRELLDATPGQRAARIEDLLSTGQTSTHEMALRVAELAVRRLAGKVDVEVGDGWKSLIPILSKSLQSYLKDLAGDVEAHVKEAGIGGALTWASGWKREEANRLNEREKAAKELEGRITEISESVGADLSRLKGQRDSLQRELGAMRERVEATKKNAGEIAETKERLASAEKSLADLTKELDEQVMIEVKDGLAGCAVEAELKKLADQRDALIKPVSGEYPEADELEKQAGKKTQEAASIFISKIPTMEKERNEVASLKAKIEAFKSSDWAEILSIADTVAQWAPPGAPDMVKASNRLREIALKNAADDPQQIEADLVDAEARLSVLAGTVAEETKIQEKSLERKADIEKQADALMTKAREIRNSGAKDYEKILGEYVAQKDAIEAQMEKLRFDRDRNIIRLQEHESLTEKVETYGKRLASLEEGSGGEVKDNRIEIQDKIDDLTKQIMALEQVAGERTALAGIVKDIENAGAAVETSKALEWALKRAREEEVMQAGGPMVEHMRKFFEGAGRSEVPFFRAEKSRVEMGWRTESDHEVLIQALSGGGWALFTAALTSAVIALRDAPLRVLLVDAGKADEKLRLQIVKGISAVSDALTHAIVETPTGLASLPDGWSVLEIGNE